jgi:hypothetical protein
MQRICLQTLKENKMNTKQKIASLKFACADSASTRGIEVALENHTFAEAIAWAVKKYSPDELVYATIIWMSTDNLVTELLVPD